MCVYSWIKCPYVFLPYRWSKWASRAGEVAGSLRFLLSFRREGVPGLRAGVLVAGAPGAYCLFGDRKWSCAPRERWRANSRVLFPILLLVHCVALSTLLLSGPQFLCRRLGTDEAWFINPCRWRSVALQPREMHLVGEWRGLGFIERTNAQQCDVMVYKSHSYVVRSPVPKKEALLCWRPPHRAQAPLVQSPHVTHWRLCAAPGWPETPALWGDTHFWERWRKKCPATCWWTVLGFQAEKADELYLYITRFACGLLRCPMPLLGDLSLVALLLVQCRDPMVFLC